MKHIIKTLAGLTAGMALLGSALAADPIKIGSVL